MRVLPKISIVTPSYNQGKYIEQTILSVLNQNYPNLEYIIIDGGSTDETVAIIEKYESRITYWVSEKDSGQTEAINKGFLKCTGDIFNWINSDDYYEPGSFNRLAELFSTNTAINVFCGREWGFETSNPEQKILHTGTVIKPDVNETIRIGIIDQPCTFWRKQVIEDFFPLDTSLRFVMDRELWWRYLLAHGQHKVMQVDDIFTHFRLHSQSKSVSEGTLFEKDFDRLKYSLFRYLKAPDILLQQVQHDATPDTIKWSKVIQPHSFLLSAFAYYYARRSYVRDDWATSAALMRWVWRWKRYNMSRVESKLWLLVCIIPEVVLKNLKKIRR